MEDDIDQEGGGVDEQPDMENDNTNNNTDNQNPNNQEKSRYSDFLSNVSHSVFCF